MVAWFLWWQCFFCLFFSSKSGTTFHFVVKAGERETIYIWNAQYQNSERLIFFFFFHPFFTPLHALLPAPKSVTLKKRRLKTSIKSSAETDCRGHSSIEKKSSKTRFFPWEKQKTNRSFRKECHNTNLSIGNSLKRTKTGLGRSKNSWLLSWEQGCIFSHGVRAYEGEPSNLVFKGPFWWYLLYFVSDHIFQINLQK